MLSSTHELVNSWTLTLGLSAGIEKILSASVKGSYHEKITYQQEPETRYSLSRRVKTEYVLFTDIPNLRLDSQFADVVLANLKRLNTGDPLEWEDFVQNYGTHYVHAITCGQTDFVEMRFSLDAECTAREKGWKLEEKAQASLEGIKFGEEAGVGHDWSTKDGFKVSSEDMTHITVGEQGKPAAIFSGPAAPLGNIQPGVFPPNLTAGAVPKKAVAPWIWHELRSSFRQYLEETAGVNKQLDPSNETDYAPRFVRVTFPEFKIWHGSASICMYGNVQLFPTNDGVEYVNAQYWSVSPDQSQRVANGSDLPALEKLTATFGVTPKILESGGGFILSFRLYDWQPLPGPDPNIENTKTYSFKSGGGVFEWHGDEGWGHKISYKVEPV